MLGRLTRRIVELASQAPSLPATQTYQPIDIHFVSREKLLAPKDWNDAFNAGDVVALERVFAAARAGDPQAQTACGHLSLAGHGGARDWAAAFRWFNAAAEQGHAEAANMVGRCYELGWGVTADLHRAAYWYRRAALQNDAWAQFNLAMMLFDGHGCQVDRKQALTWFIRASRLRHAKAMNMVGRYREEGWESAPRVRSAKEWYRRAAEGGDFRGQFNYGRLLFVAGQQQQALHWIATAIEGGIPIFCRNVAAVLRDHQHAGLRMLGARALAKANGSTEGEALLSPLPPFNADHALGGRAGG